MIDIWIDIIVVSILCLIFGGLLGYASYRFKIKVDPIIEKIDKILPQIQCGQCGYPSCRLYAEAICNKREEINKCKPGGEKIFLNLSKLLNLNIELQSIDINKHVKYPTRTLAWIDEENCIGCNKCIQVCPVDAIVGTSHMIHTVLSDVCTGCKLCISTCPTNCITERLISEEINQNWDL